MSHTNKQTVKLKAHNAIQTRKKRNTGNCKPTYEEWENVGVKKESTPSFLSKMVAETALAAAAATQSGMIFFLPSFLGADDEVPPSSEGRFTPVFLAMIEPISPERTLSSRNSSVMLRCVPCGLPLAHPVRAFRFPQRQRRSAPLASFPGCPAASRSTL